MSIEFKLYGYTGDPDAKARFDAESDKVKIITYLNEKKFLTFGTFGTDQCVMKLGTIHRDFHLQPYVNNKNCGEAFYKVNVITGGIEGNPTSKQISKFFNENNKEYVMNYGVSHASDEDPAKLKDQAYLYISSTKKNWMKELESLDPKINELVLPGAHDAGMWKIDSKFLAEAISGLIPIVYFTTWLPVIGWIIATIGGVATAYLPTILYNFAVTQKDRPYDLLRMGIRHFDFRPAKFISLLNQVVHVHGVIPGGSLEDFLNDVNKFLIENPTEVVFIEIKADGIDSKIATFLSKIELERIAHQKISVGVQVYEGDEITCLNSKRWNDLKSKGRAVFLYKPKTITSYNDQDYGASMTDPSHVEKAVVNFLPKINNSEFNLIQCQNTASNFFVDHWSSFVKHPSWVNDIALSDTGSLLADTKALFDSVLYSRLSSVNTREQLKSHNGLVAVINDFADIALVDLSIALTKTRLKPK